MIYRKLPRSLKVVSALFWGKVLIKWLSIDKVNKAHAHNCHLRGAEFTTALLNDPLIDIKI